MACGTGVVARQAAPLVGAAGQIVGLDISRAMLDVARSLPAADGAAIAWHEGSADALPFPDAAFDLALCHQGLQFFPDRAAAAREMHRVLAPGGRVGISVCRGLAHQPVDAALDEAMERHLGARAIAAAYTLGDAEDLRSLLAGAGFRGVTIEPVERAVRFRSPEQFVRQRVLGAAAVLPQLAQMDEAARDSLVEAVHADMLGTLRAYLDGDGLAFPRQAHVAVGWASPTAS